MLGRNSSGLLGARVRSRCAVAARKDSANQIFDSQLFANQNDGARETVFATMTAADLARRGPYYPALAAVYARRCSTGPDFRSASTAAASVVQTGIRPAAAMLAAA